MTKKSKQETVKVKKRKPTVSNATHSRRTVLLYFCALILFWSGALYLLARMDLNQIDSQTESFAINKTRSLLEKDITYYQWVGSQTDIYFVKTQQDGENSDSSGDVSTDAASNQRIELMQFTADALLGLSQNIWAKRTGSIIAIYTDYKQAAQEPAQLDALKMIFEGKAHSVSGKRQNGEKQYMNVMLPLEYSGAQDQGTTVTKVISLQYPMKEFLDMASKEKTILAAKYITAWLFGIALLMLILIRLYTNIRIWDKQVAQQTRKSDDLQTKVNLRTQDIIQLRKNLQDFMDQVPLSAFIKDRDSTFVAVNQRFADSLGCAKDKLIGTTGADYLPAELADYFYQFEQIILNSGDKMVTGDFEFAHHGLHFGIMLPVVGAYGQVEGVSTVLSPLAYKEKCAQDQQSTVSNEESLPADDKTAVNLVEFDNDFSETYHDAERSIQPSTAEGNVSEYEHIEEESLSQQPWEADANWVKGDGVSDEYFAKPTVEVQPSESIWPMSEPAINPDDEDLFGTERIRQQQQDIYQQQTSAEPLWQDKPPITSCVNLFETLQVKEHPDSFADGEYKASVDLESQSGTAQSPFDAPVSETRPNDSPFAASTPVIAEIKPTPFEPEPIVKNEPEMAFEKPLKLSSAALNLLVINDDLNEAQSLSNLLTKLGHAVKVADGATSGINDMALTQFDAVFMDIQMPVMNGIQATAMIRKQERQTQSGHMPIIAITTHSNPGDREKYQACGMDNYITGSTSIENLADLIEETIIEFNLKR